MISILRYLKENGVFYQSAIEADNAAICDFDVIEIRINSVLNDIENCGGLEPALNLSEIWSIMLDKRKLNNKENYSGFPSDSDINLWLEIRSPMSFENVKLCDMATALKFFQPKN